MSGFLCTMVGASFVTAVAEVIRSKKGITAVGNAQIDTAQSKFGGASVLFDGNGDYLQLANSSDFNLTGNYTIEGWWYQPSNVAAGIYPTLIGTGAVGDNKGWAVSSEPTTNKVNFITSGDGVSGMQVLLTSANLSAATWNHWAIVRNSSVLTVYINGTASGSTYTTTGNSIASTYPLYIGGGVGGLSSGNFSSSSATVVNLNGHLDEIRISNTARYTTTFTPSTTPFVNDDNTVLLIHANGTDATTFFEDDNGVRAQTSVIQGTAGASATQISTAQSKFGGSSLVFDGNYDWLSVTMPVAPGSGQFTFECWLRFDILPSSQTLDGGSYMMIYGNSAEPYLLVTNSQVSIGLSPNYKDYVIPTVSINTWYHLALTRNSSNEINVFWDGAKKTATGGAFTSTANFCNFGMIGRFVTSDGRGSFDGYMDEIRVSNTCRYTTDFVTPTAPFVNDANTLLLIHGDGTNASTVFRDDNGALAATTTGTAVTFDGSGDFYASGALTTSATDNNKALVAITFYYNAEIPWSGTNLMHLANVYLPGGNGFFTWVNGGRMQFIGGQLNIYETAENSLTPYAWNQVVFYIDASSQANCRIFVNGISRAISNDGFSNANFNWGTTNAVVKVGQTNSNLQGAGVDMNGRIAQVYISNPASFPGIERFWASGPRDLGTNGTATGLAQPLIYHYGNNDTFRTNNGTGFASYTLTANGNAGTANTNLPTFYLPRIQKSVISISGAEIDTAQSKFGGSSLLMPNDGAKYLTVKHSDDFLTGVRPFCIEGWFRPLSAVDPGDGVGSRFFYFKGINTAGGIGLGISTDGIRFRGPGTDDLAYTGTVSNSTFSHIAFTWDGTNKSIYLNGSRVSTTTAHSINVTDLSDIQIGYNSTRFGYNGHIDELRHSNVVRYTGTTYTQPTAAFQNDSNTLLLLHFDGTDGSTVFFDDNGIAPYTP